MRTPTEILFIDRLSYENIMSDHTVDSIGEQLKMLITDHLGVKKYSNLSSLTISFIRFYNYYFSRAFNTGIYNSLNLNYEDIYDYSPDSSEYKEQRYLEDMFREDYILNKDIASNDDSKKYYEIQMLPNGYFLVIFEKGFVYYLTEFKNNLQKFILDCLCVLYGYGLFSDSSSSKDVALGIETVRVGSGHCYRACHGLLKFYISLLENDNSFVYFKSMV